MFTKRLFLFIFFMMFLPAVLVWAQKKPFKKPADFWASIPAGTLNLHGDSLPIPAFWMFKTEVSNAQYKAFVTAVKQSADAQKLKTVLPDTLVWRCASSYNEPYVEYYFSHPAYADYPVVGVSYEAAQLYCTWLTQVYNAHLDEWLPKLKIKAVEVRLPTEAEWIWAAKGGNTGAVYPWGGPYLRNAQGVFLCNFSQLGDASITRNLQTGKMEVVNKRVEYLIDDNDNADVTAPVLSYWPNDYGLYNMAGNVAEMVAQKGTAKGGSWYMGGYDARIDAPDPNQGHTEPTSFIGFRPLFVVVPL